MRRLYFLVVYGVIQTVLMLLGHYVAAVIVWIVTSAIYERAERA